MIQDSKNYGALKCIQGIEDAVLAKQLNSLQTIVLSMKKTLYAPPFPLLSSLCQFSIMFLKLNKFLLMIFSLFSAFLKFK